MSDAPCPEDKQLIGAVEMLGTGINLTRAKDMIMVDPCFIPAYENQAKKCINRWGQKTPMKFTG